MPNFELSFHGEPDAACPRAERLRAGGMRPFVPELDERFDLAALLR